MASKAEKDALASYTEKLDGFKAVDKEKDDTIGVGAAIFYNVLHMVTYCPAETSGRVGGRSG